MTDPLTDNGTYYEDFVVGQRFRSARGKTVTESDNVLLSQLVMNTAQAHFNEHAMQDEPLGRRIVFGGVTASIVTGLASQDASDNAVREVRIENLNLLVPVFHGDTLYALTEVVDKSEVLDGEAEGTIRFRHIGINQRDEIVLEMMRTVAVRTRSPKAGPDVPYPSVPISQTLEENQ